MVFMYVIFLNRANGLRYFTNTAWKVSASEFSWSLFPHILTEDGEMPLSLHIPFECVKLRTRKTPNTDTFHAVPAGLFLTNFVPILLSISMFLNK